MNNHFGLPYSFPEISLDDLKRKIPMTEEEAEKLLQKFMDTYPEVKRWAEELKKKVKD